MGSVLVINLIIIIIASFLLMVSWNKFAHILVKEPLKVSYKNSFVITILLRLIISTIFYINF